MLKLVVSLGYMLCANAAELQEYYQHLDYHRLAPLNFKEYFISSSNLDEESQFKWDMLEVTELQDSQLEQLLLTEFSWKGEFGSEFEGKWYQGVGYYADFISSLLQQKLLTSLLSYQSVHNLRSYQQQQLHLRQQATNLQIKEQRLTELLHQHQQVNQAIADSSQQLQWETLSLQASNLARAKAEQLLREHSLTHLGLNSEADVDLLLSNLPGEIAELAAQASEADKNINLGNDAAKTDAQNQELKSSITSSTDTAVTTKTISPTQLQQSIDQLLAELEAQVQQELAQGKLELNRTDTPLVSKLESTARQRRWSREHQLRSLVAMEKSLKTDEQTKQQARYKLDPLLRYKDQDPQKYQLLVSSKNPISAKILAQLDRPWTEAQEKILAGQALGTEDIEASLEAYIGIPYWERHPADLLRAKYTDYNSPLITAQFKKQLVREKELIERAQIKGFPPEKSLADLQDRYYLRLANRRLSAKLRRLRDKQLKLRQELASANVNPEATAETPIGTPTIPTTIPPTAELSFPEPTSIKVGSLLRPLPRNFGAGSGATSNQAQGKKTGDADSNDKSSEKSNDRGKGSSNGRNQANSRVDNPAMSSSAHLLNLLSTSADSDSDAHTPTSTWDQNLQDVGVKGYGNYKNHSNIANSRLSGANQDADAELEIESMLQRLEAELKLEEEQLKSQSISPSQGNLANSTHRSSHTPSFANSTIYVSSASSTNPASSANSGISKTSSIVEGAKFTNPFRTQEDKESSNFNSSVDSSTGSGAGYGADSRSTQPYNSPVSPITGEEVWDSSQLAELALRHQHRAEVFDQEIDQILAQLDALESLKAQPGSFKERDANEENSSQSPRLEINPLKLSRAPELARQLGVRIYNPDGELVTTDAQMFSGSMPQGINWEELGNSRASLQGDKESSLSPQPSSLVNEDKGISKGTSSFTTSTSDLPTKVNPGEFVLELMFSQLERLIPGYKFTEINNKDRQALHRVVTQVESSINSQLQSSLVVKFYAFAELLTKIGEELARDFIKILDQEAELHISLKDVSMTPAKAQGTAQAISPTLSKSQISTLSRLLCQHLPGLWESYFAGVEQEYQLEVGNLYLFCTELLGEIYHLQSQWRQQHPDQLDEQASQARAMLQAQRQMILQRLQSELRPSFNREQALAQLQSQLPPAWTAEVNSLQDQEQQLLQRQQLAITKLKQNQQFQMRQVELLKQLEAIPVPTNPEKRQLLADKWESLNASLHQAKDTYQLGLNYLGELSQQLKLVSTKLQSLHQERDNFIALGLAKLEARFNSEMQLPQDDRGEMTFNENMRMQESHLGSHLSMERLDMQESTELIMRLDTYLQAFPFSGVELNLLSEAKSWLGLELTLENFARISRKVQPNPTSQANPKVKIHKHR